MTISVDPVIVTCAVRYALGRRSYMPGLIADEVRRCWADLGDQQAVIRGDVAAWLADGWEHTPRDAGITAAWSALAAWIFRQEQS